MIRSCVAEIGTACVLQLVFARVSCKCGHSVCSYYPLFPPAIGMMLDTTLAQRLQLPATLDVLVLPSDLNSFAKLATAGAAQTGSTVCVNPGRLTKGSSGGTFAYLQVALGQEALDKRCKVEIRRI